MYAHGDHQRSLTEEERYNMPRHPHAWKLYSNQVNSCDRLEDMLKKRICQKERKEVHNCQLVPKKIRELGFQIIHY